MGRYVNLTTRGAIGRSAGEKCDAILADGGKEIKSPRDFEPNLVCVVDNGFFGAAAYAYCEREMRTFQETGDGRPKRWFIWDKVETYSE